MSFWLKWVNAVSLTSNSTKNYWWQKTNIKTKIFSPTHNWPTWSYQSNPESALHGAAKTLPLAVPTHKNLSIPSLFSLPILFNWIDMTYLSSISLNVVCSQFPWLHLQHQDGVPVVSTFNDLPPQINLTYMHKIRKFLQW